MLKATFMLNAIGCCSGTFLMEPQSCCFDDIKKISMKNIFVVVVIFSNMQYTCPAGFYIIK